MFGYVRGWHRRFWHGSPDHRGTPDNVGRVVTLISKEDMRTFEDEHAHHEDNDITWGRIYRLPDDNISDTLEQLDHREKAGYDRQTVEVHCTDGQVRQALVYISPITCDEFLGPSSLEDMAAQIATRVGPSGSNLDYFNKLCAW